MIFTHGFLYWKIWRDVLLEIKEKLLNSSKDTKEKQNE